MTRDVVTSVFGTADRTGELIAAAETRRRRPQEMTLERETCGMAGEVWMFDPEANRFCVQ